MSHLILLLSPPMMNYYYYLLEGAFSFIPYSSFTNFYLKVPDFDMLLVNLNNQGCFRLHTDNVHVYLVDTRVAIIILIQYFLFRTKFDHLPAIHYVLQSTYNTSYLNTCNDHIKGAPSWL